jgi:hypothetical protein
MSNSVNVTKWMPKVTVIKVDEKSTVEEKSDDDEIVVEELLAKL